MKFQSLFFLLARLFGSLVFAQEPQVSTEGKACLEWHGDSTPGIVEQWRSSAHAKTGVDCYSCHKANDNDPATFDHSATKSPSSLRLTIVAVATPPK